MKRYGLIILVLVMALSACGGDDSTKPSSGGLEGASESTSVQQATTDDADDIEPSPEVYSMIDSIPEPIDQDFIMPQIDGLDGRLLFVQGNTDNQSPSLGAGGKIFLANFDGSQPQQLAERVSEPSVIVSPDGSMIGYAAVSGASWYMYVMDLTTQEPVQLRRLQNRFGFIEDWSPDMEWILFRNNATRHIARVDGSELQELGNVFTFWTDDNRLLMVQSDEIFGVGDLERERTLDAVYIFDPATQTRTDVEFGNAIITLENFRITDLNNALTEYNTQLVSNSWGSGSVFGFPIVLMPDLTTQFSVGNTQLDNNDVEPCTDWILTTIDLDDTSEPSEIYAIENTLGLTDFMQTAEDGYIFQRWYSAECNSEPETLRGEIIHITSDGEVEMITDEIYPGISTAFLRASTGKKYALSTDERYMAWVGGSLESINSSIYLTDLASGKTAELMTWTADNTNRFLIWEAYNAVFWIP